MIATHTGHVYGTITPNSLHLFAPQTQNGKKPAKEEDDKFVKALKKQQQKFSRLEAAEDQTWESGGSSNSTGSARSSEKDSIVSSNTYNLPRIDPQKLSADPNLSRNGSAYSNLGSVIGELKARQERQKGTESPTNSSIKDELKLVTNLDDIFWLYDEVVTEYKNRQNIKNKPIKAV